MGNHTCNWFEKLDSLRNLSKITAFDRGGETTFGSSYQEVKKTEGSTNRDSAVLDKSL